MKPFALFSSLTFVSIVAAILMMYVVLGLFEKQLGTPYVYAAGEVPFRYDTEVMAFAPCFGAIGYLVGANGFFFPLILSQIPPFGRSWWIATGLVLALPFTIPMLLILSALFGSPPEPVVVGP